jgi:D-3-phosphoglycerate dehydrogenase
VHRIVDVNGFTVDLGLDEHTVFFRYTDRPGVVGTLGRILGESGVNIAGMQVSRNARGGEALVVLTVDSVVPDETLEEITEAIGATWSRAADLGN